MTRQPAFMISCSAELMTLAAIGLADEYGTAGEAKAMLKKAVSQRADIPHAQ